MVLEKHLKLFKSCFDPAKVSVTDVSYEIILGINLAILTRIHLMTQAMLHFEEWILLIW